MNFLYFVGIDVSKLTLDFTVLHNDAMLFHLQTPNSLKGIKGFIQRLNQESDCQSDQVLYCLEFTGIYNHHLLNYCETHQLQVWVESAREIKQSLGMLRGKNDQVDSYRIAQYAFRNRDKIRLWKPSRKKIRELKSLLSLRERLVNTRQQLATPLKEAQGFVDNEIVQFQKATLKPVLATMTKRLKVLEQKIEDFIRSDQTLNELYEQVTSVHGIGPNVAAHFIATTNEFKDFTEAKKFACYSGVVPFDYRSGTSLKGRSRISHLANKKMKKLLHLSAMAAIRGPGELQDYYHRKVELGKNKMLVLNAIRNKLIHRVFAVVRDNRKYEKTYAISLV